MRIILRSRFSVPHFLKLDVKTKLALMEIWIEPMTNTKKSLDEKLARIHADPRGARDFILADAKDADMALSIGAPGRSPEAHPGEVRYRSLAEFRDIIVEIVEQKLVDIMLLSASTSEVLTIHRRLF